jgi:hypothetical protein
MLYHSGYCSVTYLINESQLGYHSDMSLDKLLLFGPLAIRVLAGIEKRNISKKKGSCSDAGHTKGFKLK